MAQLAIKGHPTRGKEVIEILEMLGGKNTFHRLGTEYGLVCYIDDKNNIFQMQINDYNPCSNYTIFTLEEFLEKFPYKVGDEVIAYAEGCLAKFIIQYIRWNYELNKVEYKICSSWIDASLIMQPYKEETMEEINIDIPKGYEFAKIDNDKQQIVFTRIQPQYPKDYEECCDVLGILDNRGFGFINLSECENILMSRFIQLKRCRDAYWKIAGEGMGLDKPWEPDWDNLSTPHEFIKINKGYFIYSSRVLVFPTEEMRDAFKENFKGLIEQCKELL